SPLHCGSSQGFHRPDRGRHRHLGSDLARIPTGAAGKDESRPGCRRPAVRCVRDERRAMTGAEVLAVDRRWRPPIIQYYINVSHKVAEAAWAAALSTRKGKP